MTSILKVDHIEKYFGNKGNVTKAINDISFNVEKGKLLGLWDLPEVGRQPYSTVFLPLIK